MSSNVTKTQMKPFEPSIQQLTAKQRFKRKAQERELLRDESTYTLEEIVEMSGFDRVAGWMRDPAFSSWFMDRDIMKDRVQAYADAAVGVLFEIMTSERVEKELTARDQLMAAKELLLIADRYPNKRKEFVYLDKDVGAMDEKKVLEEKRKYQALLGGSEAPNKALLESEK